MPWINFQPKSKHFSSILYKPHAGIRHSSDWWSFFWSKNWKSILLAIPVPQRPHLTLYLNIIPLAQSDLGNGSAAVTEVIIWNRNVHINSELTGLEETVQLMGHPLIEHSQVRYHTVQHNCAVHFFFLLLSTKSNLIQCWSQLVSPAAATQSSERTNLGSSGENT